ncbi:unnamed protein product [Durusdinium trenchii]|uniref:Uncharacterized protein n=2 Tax=Durusdinium trenchii TaxID=1381693 RepID=A0ABP0HI53_9DINO
MYIRFAVAALVIGTSLYLLVELANCQFSGTLTPTRAGHMWLQTASLIGSSNLLATGLDPWPPQHRPNGTLLKQPWVSGGQENPCVPALHHLSPRGDYEYHPSDVEKEWMKFPRRKKICKTAREQQEQSRIWMNYTASVFKANQRPDREPTEEEARVLSYFSYPRSDGSRVKRYVEPLSGVARHPLWLCLSDKSIDGQNTTYLLPENACTKDGNRAKGVFFDLGSGQNVRDFEMYDYAEGSGMGSSIPLFFRMYADRCIDFHAIYAWEVRHVDHNQFWDPLPDEIRARLRFFNRPVQENGCPDSPQGNFSERGGFLNMLASTVSLDDYVVVKVDIDSLGMGAGPELAIVESIAHLPELSTLIDELYFEYHFYFDGATTFGWGGGNFGGRDVDTAINLMVRLREAGIRSHFWV